MPKKRDKTLRTEVTRIEKLLRDAGVYQPYYRDTVEHLAGLYLDLVDADREYAEAREEGEGVTVSQVNKAGMEYRVLNPILQAKYRILDECAFYEGKLGLTPADHRKILNDLKEQPESSLGAALRILSS